MLYFRYIDYINNLSGDVKLDYMANELHIPENINTNLYSLVCIGIILRLVCNNCTLRSLKTLNTLPSSLR